MFVYLLRKRAILFCCCLLAMSAHVRECATGKEQTVLRLKIFWDFYWWWAYWRSRWLLNTGQRTLYTVRQCLVQLWAEIGANYTVVDAALQRQPSREEPVRDKLFKLRPVVDDVFEHFQRMYSMSQNVCIDESLLLSKGRLHFNQSINQFICKKQAASEKKVHRAGRKQYISIKHSHFGVKLFKLCESSSGYIYHYRIYVGKDNLLQFLPGIPQPQTQFGPTERIVWFLMLTILKKGHHLYVDNYYTSIPLFTTLLMTRCRNMAIHLYTK